MIEKTPNIQHIMPFIIKNIESNYDTVVYNGSLKKNMYVMIIDALFNNELINIEYHVRQYLLYRSTYSSRYLSPSCLRTD